MDKNFCTIRDPQVRLNTALEKFTIRSLEPISHTYRCGKEKSGLRKVISLALRWHKRLLSFMSKQSNFSISKPSQIGLLLLKKGHKKGRGTALFSEKIPPFVENNGPSQREADVFRMKAITLIQNQAPLFPSIKKALASLKESPITVAFSKSTNLAANSVITLEQKLTPFPGETIVLKGAFIRSTNSLTPTIPILESFELSMKSEQTGFPHPSQYIGWSLSDALIPVQPLCEKQLTSIASLLKKKETISAELQHGSLSAKAKKLLWKKEAFVNDNREEFLALHEKLSIVLLKAGSKEANHLNLQIINKFFTWLRDQPSAYSLLSNAYFLMNENFVLLPFKRVLKLWIDQHCDPLSNEFKTTFFETRRVLETTRKVVIEQLATDRNQPEPMHDYIMTMGRLIGTSSDRIILQHLSGIMDELPPPFLTGFEKKLQAAAYKQLASFISELTNDSEETSFVEIKKSLLSDIRLFEQSNVRITLTNKLEVYYFSSPYLQKDQKN